MAKEGDSIHLLSCAIEASLGNDFPAFAFRLPGEDGFYWGACEPDRLMTLADGVFPERQEGFLSLIHISEPTRQAEISYAVFCLKKKKKKTKRAKNKQN